MRLFCQYAGQWLVSAALKIKKAPKIRSFSILCKDWIRTIKAVPTQYIVYFAAGSREIYSNQKPALRAGLVILVIYVGRTGFEPATPWSQTTYSTGLNYLPKFILLSSINLLIRFKVYIL